MRAVRRTRSAFTLVELLVATAVTILIMVLLSAAFRGALDAFRMLRSSGTMQDKLRTAADIIRRDLGSPHFDGPYQPGLSGPYLSDQRLDKPGWMPPSAGFFRFWQSPQNPTTSEGTDADGIPSTRASGNILHFTVKYLGSRRGDYFTATAPNGLLTNTVNPASYTATDLPAYNFTDPNNASNQFLATRWGEVAYFLVNTQTTTPGGLPIFTLYRRVRIVPLSVPTTAGSPINKTSGTYFLEVSQDSDPRLNQPSTETTQDPDPSRFVALTDLTDPSLRMGAKPGNAQGVYETQVADGAARPPTWQEQRYGSLASPSPTGEDILLTDVLSFEVKPSWTADPNSTTLTAVPSPPANVDYPFADLPTSGGTNAALTGVSVFDTWTMYSSKLPTLANVDWGNPSTTSPGYLAASNDQVPLRIRINAFQIRIRIWDRKTQQARQITIVQTV